VVSQSQQKLLCVLGLWGLVLVVHQVMWHFGAPYPFTKDDNFSYFLPLAQAQSEIFAGFQIPKMVWQLGAGWDPFTSSQLGVFYPLHLLAYGVSALLGEPMWQMEVLVLLHQMVLAVLVMLWAPGDMRRNILLAVCLLFVPASFLLGMVWWAYGCAHVWWVGLILLTHHEAAKERPFASHVKKLIFTLMLLCNFMASHPQMFAWGGLFLLGWILLAYPANQRMRLVSVLVGCGLPLLPGLLYIKSLADLSGGVAIRPDGIILELSQSVSTALVGGLLGGLGGLSSIQLFAHEYVEGPSLFFQPAVFVCAILAFRQRRWGFLGLAFLCFIILGAQSFPFLAQLNLGPFNGFRWTFKLAVLTAPFFILFFVLVQGDAVPKNFTQAFLCLVAVASLIMCVQGRHFNFMAEAYGTQKHAGRMMEEARACLQEAKIPEGARLVFVGDYPGPPSPVPAAALALTGNTAMMLGVNATHLYEHLESGLMAAGHLNLTGRYGKSYESDFFALNKTSLLEGFRFIGGTHLFTLDAQLFQGPKKTLCTSPSGERIFFEPISNARAGTYPHPASYEDASRVERNPNGELWVPGVQETPPELNTPAPVSWIKEEGGWRGHPNPVDPIWGSLSFLLAGMVFLVFRRRP
tara:strand:+ start:638 stop:2539 length:1902 start_codon:yes stop_codon:yes gene_type:complete